jgi:4-hydroxybenzoyl-CoA thioesterase
MRRSNAPVKKLAAVQINFKLKIFLLNSLSRRISFSEVGYEEGSDMAVFRYSIDVMFQHCDPAGIVFYPRFFEMMNEVTERFFKQSVGWPLSRMHAVDGRGIPSVSARLDFRAPARLGDIMDWSMWVARLGRSSATMAYAAEVAGGDVLGGEATIVHTDLEAMSPLPWTAEVRSVLEAHLHLTGEK